MSMSMTGAGRSINPVSAISTRSSPSLKKEKEKAKLVMRGIIISHTSQDKSSLGDSVNPAGK
jgi:hypothetical protein